MFRSVSTGTAALIHSNRTLWHSKTAVSEFEDQNPVIKIKGGCSVKSSTAGLKIGNSRSCIYAEQIY